MLCWGGGGFYGHPVYKSTILQCMRNVTLMDYFAEFTTKNISILPAPWIKQNSDSLLPDDGLR